jgi:hypothetical protein
MSLGCAFQLNHRANCKAAHFLPQVGSKWLCRQCISVGVWSVPTSVAKGFARVPGGLNSLLRGAGWHLRGWIGV